MPGDAVELIAKMFQSQDDPGAFLAYFDSDVILFNTASSPETRPFVGHEGLRAWDRSTRDAIARYRWEPEEFVEIDDERVLCVVHIVGTARSAGIPFDQVVASVMTVRRGKIVEIRSYASKEEALGAVGLSDSAGNRG